MPDQRACVTVVCERRATSADRSMPSAERSSPRSDRGSKEVRCPGCTVRPRGGGGGREPGRGGLRRAHSPRGCQPDRTGHARSTAHRFPRGSRPAQGPRAGIRAGGGAYIRKLTGTGGVALFDGEGGLLARDPPEGPVWNPALLDACARGAADAISGHRRVLSGRQPAVISQPLVADDTGVIGVLVVVTAGTPAPGMLGAVGEVARYAASQIELAELDASRARLDRAEVIACGRRSARTSSTTR